MKYYVKFKRYYDSDELFPDEVDFVFESNFRKGSFENRHDAFNALYDHLDYVPCYLDFLSSVYGMVDLTLVSK